MDPAAVRTELERILASAAFATAGRHSRLLRYLVERTLAGHGDQLKEYVLGTEVFDRTGDYDPRLDSIVRVEARRLRSRLDDYYRDAGANDPVVITIPRGSYVPVFAEREEPAPGAAHLVAPMPLRGRDRGSYTPLRIVAAAVAIAMVLIAAGITFDTSRTPSAEAARGPALAVLPIEHYSTDDRHRLLAARLTDTITTELARTGAVSVASRTSASQYSGAPRSVPAIAQALDVQFVIESSAVFAGDRIRLAVRLVDGTRDRKVWIGEYDFAAAEIPAIAERIASEVAAAALSRISQG